MEVRQKSYKEFGDSDGLTFCSLSQLLEATTLELDDDPTGIIPFDINTV